MDLSKAPFTGDGRKDTVELDDLSPTTKPRIRWQVDGHTIMDHVIYYHVFVFDGEKDLASCKVRFSVLDKIHHITHVDRYLPFPSKHITTFKHTMQDHVFAARREAELDSYFIRLSQTKEINQEEMDNLISYWKKVGTLPVLRNQRAPEWKDVKLN